MVPGVSVTEKRPYIIKGMCQVMGTFVTIIVVYPDFELAQKAIQLAFKEIYRINNLMSAYKAGSEVSELNKKGYCDNVSPDTRYVVGRANHFSELTDGSFDITLLPVLKMWESHARKDTFPSESELSKKMKLVGYKNIVMNDSRIEFRIDAMSITLAGVAKGYAVDKAIETLRQNNIRHALVNGGGDIRVIGGKTNDSPWRIGLLDPSDKTRIFTTVDIYDQAVATSGSYRRFFNDLLDPKRGRPAQDLLSSTIITEKAIDADVLATAVFVLGTSRGMNLLDKFEGVKALLITNEGDFISYHPKGERQKE